MEGWAARFRRRNFGQTIYREEHFRTQECSASAVRRKHPGKFVGWFLAERIRDCYYAEEPESECLSALQGCGYNAPLQPRGAYGRRYGTRECAVRYKGSLHRGGTLQHSRHGLRRHRRGKI